MIGEVCKCGSSCECKQEPEVRYIIKREGDLADIYVYPQGYIRKKGQRLELLPVEE